MLMLNIYLYHHGLGVDKNESTAVEWYCKAAEQGHADAQDRVSLLSSKLQNL